MHRQPLLAMLDHYRKRYADEADAVDQMSEFVRAHTDCFDRQLSGGHVTGSAWLVSDDRERVLLTHHRKLNRWLQLGGHADGDPDILAVALREAEEESRLLDIEVIDPVIFDIDIHNIPARKSEPQHLHYDVRFVLRASGDQSFRVSEESNQLAWLSMDELAATVADASMLRMAEKWRGKPWLTEKNGSVI